MFLKLKNFLLRTRRFFHTKECSWNNDRLELERRLKEPLYLEAFGYKVYSQNDEDGMIEEIFNRIGTTNKIFVEFGVQNGLESNGHFLLHKGWKGLWIEGSKKHCKDIRILFKKPIEEKQLAITNNFITAENINEIISKYFTEPQIDLLSIDIDGNDYHIWKAIQCTSPRVVVIEFNSKFPPHFEWVMPYNPTHVWDKTDYFGASLKSFEILGNELGYQLVGTNLNGTNAFFVKKELAKTLFATPATAENLYNPARYNLVYRSRFHSCRYIG
ncbi:MAG: hypothetical protein LBR60_01625 [Fibrobacter sp.]|jgi:hypothetical protein|nr:hypothetical protein [Fibrobacter sp.]